jgi:uncharacterized membrane protein
MSKTKFLTQSAAVAAIYAAMTLAFHPVSFLQTQLRVSEVLTVLPALTPAAIPGLFIGCLVSNLFSPVGIPDIVFGSLATLAAAFLSYKMPKNYLAAVPPVIVNAVVIGFVLHYTLELPLLATMMWVALGQAVVCFGLGYPFLLLMKKLKIF